MRCVRAAKQQKQKENQKAATTLNLKRVNLAHMKCDLAPGSLPIQRIRSAVVDGVYNLTSHHYTEFVSFRFFVCLRYFGCA